MKQTESKHKHTAAERAGEFKTRLALLRRAALLCLGLCAALICAALPVAAQSLSVDHNIAYVGEDLTFTYTPASSDCPPDPEAATVYRDLTIYVGSVTQFDIPMSINSDGTFTGIYKTTTNDIGNDNWVEGFDECNNKYYPIELEFAVLEFGYFNVYDATRINPTNVVAVKHPGGSVRVDAMSFPPNYYASTLYDWNLSSDCISWRQDNWGGYASRNVPYDYYFSVTLDGVYWNWLDAWVIWASITPLSANTTETTMSPNLFTPPSSGVAYDATSAPNNFMENGDGFITCRNGILFQATLYPSGIGSVASFNFIRTRKTGFWEKENEAGGWALMAGGEDAGSEDGPGAETMDLTPHNDHIYNADVPGFKQLPDYSAYGLVMKASLDECVQVNLNGWQRCSDHYFWHSVVWIDNNMDQSHPTWSRVAGNNSIGSGPLDFDNKSSTP